MKLSQIIRKLADQELYLSRQDLLDVQLEIAKVQGMQETLAELTKIKL